MSKAICTACWDIMESTYRHDFVWCKCNNHLLMAVDDYFRAGGFTHGIPDDTITMTADEFWDYLDRLDKEIEQEQQG
jgi:hypothetical protein